MVRLVSVLAIMSALVWAVVAFGPGSATTGPAVAQTASAGAAAEQTQAEPKAKKNQKPGAKAKAKAAQAAETKSEPTKVPAPVVASPPAPDESGVSLLSSGDSYDDFASVAQTSDGSLYVAYAAYYDGHDQIRMHKQLKGGNWSTRTHVPLVQAKADIWMPQLAVDSSDRVWVIWCEQTGQSATASGNWDLYARPLDGTSWGPIVRLSDNPKPDINPHVAVDAKHNIYVVWQAHPENDGDIMLCRFDGKSWSKPKTVTSGPAADWYPQVAVDLAGKAWIAFDSYRNGDYDVFLTSVDGDEVGDVIAIADTDYYEAHPTLTCTDGKVYVAWEQGGFNWGKDQGYWLRRPEGPDQKPAEAHPSGGGYGTPLGSKREVHVAVYHNGMLRAAPGLAGALPAEDLNATALPVLASGADGRVWLALRRQNRGVVRGRNQASKFWTQDISYLTESGWKPVTSLPGSKGRISVFSRILPTPDGGLAIAYSGDRRTEANYHQPIHDQALVSLQPKPAETPGTPLFDLYKAPAPPPNSKPWDTARETAQVKAIREYRATIDGKPHRIVRGDLHRHTEMSWDVGPGNDGSYLDFYRYMIDVASMDFGALTDHQGGGHYAYHWWLTEKSADMYHLAPRFVPLYGYERSVKFPNGHRNVFHSSRGVPIFAFQLKLDQTGVFPGVATGEVLDNDTKLLYDYLRKSGGIAISHTSATDSMGTDWRDNDPEIEPVVEIYQGARNSYETLGAPRVHDIANLRPDQAPGGFQAAGMVWNALAKGYRLGTTSSSDHGSTHISYSLVYTPENDRKSILDAIRRRHTYGATDNMIVEVRAGDRFMGDESASKQRPEFELKVQATDKIARIDLIRNGRYIYTTSPAKTDVSIKYMDAQPDAGLNYYYFRIQQEDGELAWASPIWINYDPK